MIKNILYSFSINFINFLFPLILIPFYIHVFGITNYGLIAISFSLINYISVINDYSWNALGPIKIGKLSSDFKAINNYISTVINTKLLLTIPTFLLLFVFAHLYNAISSNSIFFLSLFMMLFSRTQNAHWIFIGLNKVKIYFVINSIFKISCLLTILFFVKSKNSFQILFFILGFFDCLIFITAYIYLFIKEKFKYTATSLKDIYAELQSGFKMFLTNLTVCSILNSGTLILGVFYSSKIVGIYSVSEKVIMLGKHAIGVLFQGVFPKICTIGVASISELNKTLRQIFKYYILLFSAGTLFLIVFSEQIISVLSSSHILESSRYLILLSPIPLIASLNQSAYMSLLIHEKKNIYFSGYFFGLIINISFSFLLSYFFKVEGMITALIITELFITLFLNYNILRDKNLNFLSK
ncbi:oligosaccharide flippase family protein [Flavobacterium phragmitis]|uniref:Membrane protein involved in the export of O-antigen and teichoic acid n=1 Tax=Flavobacterium phragmitis TaxID=739143 RepID=A0A1I1KEP2_9FLAO|nr:oligosaccharide flippase family protein [Flavobacterium phragmitis]SFC55950.1 Membrane protein involved in the export of O-antigen and teichoic acid [Flavobacterium phragmitis]